MGIEQLTAQVMRHMATQRAHYTSPVPGMGLFQRREPTEFTADFYEPFVCLILQGRKETIFDDISMEVAAGQSLLVSHDVPVRARIREASSEFPYLSVVLRLDIPLLRSLYDEVGAAALDELEGRSCAVHEADPRLIDCLERTLALADDPLEARILLPQVRRELHFRLLMAPHGGMLRALLHHDSHASHIARAISRIRRDFRQAITVPELAREVGMSESSFHKHFRDITSSTPLQYQKELRLIEARRLLTAGAQNVTSVAYDVGYSSPNQFSREYSRKFGVPPSTHLA
ncbi:MAG: AraC family transcriptional regulator [Myxococcota bacterium]